MCRLREPSSGVNFKCFKITSGHPAIKLFYIKRFLQLIFIIYCCNDLPYFNISSFHLRALLVFCIGICWCKSVSCLTGLLIYAHYQDCDPLTTKVMPTLFTKVTISYNSMNGNVPVSVNLRMSHKTRYIFFE